MNPAHPDRIPSRIPELTGRTVTVMGLGSFGGGVAAVRFLVEQGAKVIVTDTRDATRLAESLDVIRDLQLRDIFLNGHPPEAFAESDLVVVNPAVRPGNPALRSCIEADKLVVSEIELLLSAVPCEATVVGITGTNGKSTTTSLIAHLLSQCRQSTGKVRLGGNVGISLLPQAADITSDDVIVLELSSFQLEHLRGSGLAPDIAVITNLSPNHLDWHETFEAYRAAKQVLLQRQKPTQLAVLPSDEDGSDQWRVRGRRMHFGTADYSEDGAFLEEGSLILRRGPVEDAIRLNVPPQLPGEHNRMNVAAACCAAWSAGADADGFQTALNSFRPLPHRLEPIGRGNGIRFVNDSNSTTPESTIAALRTMEEPCVLIAGGADKGVDLSDLAKEAAACATGVVVVGETGPVLHKLVSRALDDQSETKVAIATDFEDAFRTAVALASEGGIVLLSPGCASFGWFRDYRDRGEQFVALVRDWMKST